jgi:hypothetical protein
MRWCVDRKCACHKKILEPSNWVEDAALDFYMVFLGTSLNNGEVTVMSSDGKAMLDWIKDALTEAYNLGKKEEREKGDTRVQNMLRLAEDSGKAAIERGIRSERERILAALPELHTDPEHDIVSGRVEDWNAAIEEIRAIITNPQNRE